MASALHEVLAGAKQLVRSESGDEASSPLASAIDTIRKKLHRDDTGVPLCSSPRAGGYALQTPTQMLDCFADVEGWEVLINKWRALAYILSTVKSRQLLLSSGNQP